MNLRFLTSILVLCLGLLCCNQSPPANSNVENAVSKVKDQASAITEHRSDDEHCEAPDYHTDLESFNAYVEDLIDKGKLHGLSLGVVSKDKLIFHQGYGVRDHRKRLGINKDTVFRIASVSKTLTAASFMQAAQAGLLNCDANINDQNVQATGEPLIPFKLQNPSHLDKEITPHMVSEYFGSIKDDWNVLRPLYGEDVPMEEFIEGYLAEGGTYHSEANWNTLGPGKVWCYSNVSATFTAYITGRAANMKYPEYSQENLLKPLGMKNSAWFAENLPEKARKNMAIPYSYYDSYQKTPETTPYPFYPGGGLYSSVQDLANFLRMVLNDGNFEGKQILKPGTAKSLGMGHHLPNCNYQSSDMWFRFEKVLEEIPDELAEAMPGVIMKMGSSYGVNSMVLVDFHSNRAYIALANGRHENDIMKSVNNLAKIVAGLWCRDVTEKIDFRLLSKILENIANVAIPGGTIDGQKLSTCSTCQEVDYDPTTCCEDCITQAK